MIEDLLRVFSRSTMELILRNPRENPQAIIVLIGILIVLIFILLLLLGLFYLRPDKKTQSEADMESQLRKVLFFLQFSGLAFVLLWGTASYLTSTDSFCVRCHQERPYADSLKRTVHKNASCLSCHQPPGLSGWVREKTSMNERFVSWLAGGDVKKGTKIDNWSCLRCHKEVLGSRAATTRNISIRHRDIQDAGYLCVDCHSNTAHPGQGGRRFAPSMFICVNCHYQKKKTACILCHPIDPGKNRSGNTRHDFPATIIENPKCSSCHLGLDVCKDCHQGRDFP